ncbi:Fic family protein [Candidatus Woesearchaeota archaeon]|nr:Fic family protein [Candidatus Woesearchaeota archaeon]
MVEIKKIKKGNKEYFYLVHSFREGKSVKKKQIYLGDNIPKNIEKKKKEFIQEFYKNKYLDKLDEIKKKFNKEYIVMPTSARKKSRETFATRFTYNTQRIEGSTLSLKDTANLLERGITPSSKPINDVKEAEAHKKVFFEMLDYDKDLSLQIVLKWHKELMNCTQPSIAGKIRNHNVLISQSKFKPPMHMELDFLLKEFFDWYKKEKNKIHPVELAALVHLKFVTIHPFTDGNGRISRLMMNFILKKFDFPLLDIPYLKRNSYYNALERSQVKKDKNIFIQWFFRRYLDEYKDYYKKI